MHKDKRLTENSNSRKKNHTEKVVKYWNYEALVSPSSDMFKLGFKETMDNVI